MIIITYTCDANTPLLSECDKNYGDNTVKDGINNNSGKNQGKTRADNVKKANNQEHVSRPHHCILVSMHLIDSDFFHHFFLFRNYM